MSETPGPQDFYPLAEPSGRAEPPAPPLWTPPPPMAEPAAPELRPVPFEDLEAMPGFWERVGAMFRLVFTNPFELFDRVPVTESIGAPWRFLLLLSVPTFLIVALVFSALGMGASMAALGETRVEERTVAVLMPVILGVILLLLPLFSFLGMIIGGAFSHFFLWVWGGLRPGVGLNQTVRAYGYASAFLQICTLVPYLGLLLQLAGMVVLGMGLARMHRTDTWRGVCAALTPLVLACCCLVPLLLLAIPVLSVLGHH